MKSILGMCFNPRVLAAVAVIGIGLWLVAPQVILAALPLLVLAICPLSMALMAWSMRGSAQGQPAADPAARLATLEREQISLAREVARARAELESGTGPAEPREALPTPSRADH